MEVHTVSVVIPTTGRRQELLLRAIKSTYVNDGSLSINVIVVVNGSKSNEFNLPDGIHPPSNFSIKVIRTQRANVSHARNIGIDNAKGKLIRFLDDDDFLIPEIARNQYLEAIGLLIDISTYAGEIRDETGKIFQTITPGNINGYACAVLGPNCPALTFASVYRIDTIRRLRWNEEWSTTEDEDWMRRILTTGNPKWIANDKAVGIWYQHSSHRLSKPHPTNELYVNRASSIIKTTAALKQENRFGETEASAAARGLWSAIHGGFYFSPFFWGRIGKLALQMDNTSRPADKIFSLFSFIHPLVIEWAMLPKRIANHFARLVKGRIAGFDSVRKIP